MLSRLFKRSKKAKPAARPAPRKQSLRRISKRPPLKKKPKPQPLKKMMKPLSLTSRKTLTAEGWRRRQRSQTPSKPTKK